MSFWIVAAIALAIAAFITCLPLIRPKTSWTPIALALVFALPTSALMLYQYVGTPAALDQVAVIDRATNGNESLDIDAMVASLRAKLTQSPKHLEGWMLLARTLKTLQRFPEALEALETARRIAPEDSTVAVELIEARIFTSGQGRIDHEMIAVLEEAVARDPGQQKGLWLLGIASFQSGDDARAIEYWQALLQQLEPGGAITASVQEQITLARKRLGIEPDVGADREELEPDVSVDSAGIKLHLSAGDELKANMPSNAVLFVIIRSAGAVAGPPLGVRRINSPTLPLELTIGDQDSMLAERKISSEPELRIQARLSLSGAPKAQNGDWQSIPVMVPLKTTQTVQLVMDQRVD